MNDKPKVKDWMLETAHDIDLKVGLSRSDQAIQWTAEIIAEHHMAAQIKDMENSDEAFRRWWDSLTPGQKADRYKITGKEREIFIAHCITNKTGNTKPSTP